ncbi:MAG: DedA family protein [Terriglobales bacterium]|jgi:membrane-associated protein
MNHAPLEWLRTFILDYGYWAVALALLSESAGIPVPGEITLLLASFLAYSEHRLHLASIIVVATCATTLGGDLGYVLGYYGGRPVLDRYQSLFRIPPAALKRGEEMLARYGAATIFFARFVFGMRTFAGPLAGVLRMRWRAFALFNFLGAAVWVTFIASTGFLFGHHWRSLVRVMQRLNVAALMIAVAVVLFLWLKNRRQKPADG